MTRAERIKVREQAGSDASSIIDVGILLIPNYPMICFASVVDPLRAANRMAGRTLYRWHFISPDGEAVTASNGVMIFPEHGLHQDVRYDRVVVVAGLQVADYKDRATFAWLRRQAHLGANMGATSMGPLILARAGLLHGYRFTVHWESIESVQEEFPDETISSALYEIDRDRFTCAGGIAALDMMHAMIEADFGAEIAGGVSEQFLHGHVRAADDPQRMALRERLGISHGKLLHVLELMEAHVEDPLPREFLAREAGVSVRQLERLFRSYVGRTLGQYYLDIRLTRARALLQQTSQSVLDVAVACGFVSASHFSRAYRQRFGYPPRTER